MARGLIDQYGPNSSQPQVAPATRGGVRKGDPMDIDVMNYKPPVGPKNVMDPQTPGIHGPNQGPDGTQGGTAGGQGYRGPFGPGWRKPLPGGCQGKY